MAKKKTDEETTDEIAADALAEIGERPAFVCFFTESGMAEIQDMVEKGKIMIPLAQAITWGEVVMAFTCPIPVTDEMDLSQFEGTEDETDDA
jgi:hypothetical protein